MIEVKDLTVRIGGSTIIRGISFKVPDGSVFALVGPNGAGKTTTLKAVMGLLRHGGSVLLDGEDLSALGPSERAARGIGYAPEDRRLFPSLTVEENLNLPVASLGISRKRVEEVLELIPALKGLLKRPAYALSGGQQKLVALARALVVGRRAILLDELFEGLSPKMRDDLSIVIKQVAREWGVSVILAESNQRYVAFADAVARIDRGELVQGYPRPGSSPDPPQSKNR
ncbi:MAG: ATP-binding cassette domain-containing protein [Desulfurococcaceae archaeon]